MFIFRGQKEEEKELQIPLTKLQPGKMEVIVLVTNFTEENLTQLCVLRQFEGEE